MSSPAKRLPRRDAAANRVSLLAAARIVFNLDPGASLEAVAAEAGLSRRSVYGHFANREELQLELVTAGARRVASAVESVTHPDPLVRLALIASTLWREVESVRVMAVVAVRGPLALHTAAALGSIRANVRTAIIEGQTDGSMRGDLPVERLARLVEHTALVVLEDSTAHPLDTREGGRLVMLMTLATIGLGWRDAGEFIDGHSELNWPADPEAAGGNASIEDTSRGRG
ncbi:TetR/AcrR family transcriptional regulator [Frigoribacterium sp. CG_9.8]|uniref:TetR/AcrR family transcriptional regulator n=1 Tax=Frigoribacterium sp. CG_9.8 TaxID=2787733 RepID=UPI0018C9BDAE|nr:TetR/AcrR family transcriptional regulator [Frigoribacterium sp. CG_9.8]MBG6108579.1 AcrR family transcriptional regulator [Frigoribacterium sp. CG_9.8]